MASERRWEGWHAPRHHRQFPMVRSLHEDSASELAIYAHWVLLLLWKAVLWERNQRRCSLWASWTCLVDPNTINCFEGEKAEKSRKGFTKNTGQGEGSNWKQRRKEFADFSDIEWRRRVLNWNWY